MPSFRHRPKRPMNQHVVELTVFVLVMHVLVRALAFRALVHVQVEEDTK